MLFCCMTYLYTADFKKHEVRYLCLRVRHKAYFNSKLCYLVFYNTKKRGLRNYFITLVGYQTDCNLVSISDCN
jgi:hypothetical protein